MYQVPSEFIRQKNTIVGPIAIEHGLGIFAGFLVSQVLGGSILVLVLCVALGLAMTVVQVQGLTLYRFVPLFIAFLLRKLTDDSLEPEEETITAPEVAIALFDEDGTPIIYQEAG